MVVYWIATIVLRRHEALAAFLFVMALAAYSGTKSVAVSYMLSSYLQPSTLGSLGYLAALAFFLKGRWVASGICAGLGGLFHANFMVLLCLILPLAQLALGWRGLVRRMFLQMTPVTVAFLFLAPTILMVAMSPDGEAGREILYKIRGGHHYNPVKFYHGFMFNAAWQVVGVGSAFYLLRDRVGRITKLGAFLLATCLVLWGATALTTAVYYDRVAALFPWRLAPFTDMLFQLLFFAGVVRVLTRPNWFKNISAIRLILVAAGLALFFAHYGIKKKAGMVSLLSNVVLAAMAVRAVGALGELLTEGSAFMPKVRRWCARLAVWPVVFFAGYHWWGMTGKRLSYAYIKQRSMLIKGLPKPETALYDWIHQNTPKTAMFLSPPTMGRFRLHSERAIVVDWKVGPVVPTEVVQWYRRLCDVAGRTVKGAGSLNQGYQQMTKSRLGQLQQRYGFEYAVFASATPPKGLKGVPVLYKNRRYVVLDTRPVE